MGLKRTRSTILIEALEINCIRYTVVTVPVPKAKKSRSWLRLLGRSSSERLEMGKNNRRYIEVMASKTGNGRNARFTEIQIREDANLDRCLVSEKVAKALLHGAQPERIDPLSVSLSDGQTYRCEARLEARWCEKSNYVTGEVILYVAQGINEQGVFPKGKMLEASDNRLAPVAGRPKTSEEKKQEALRGKAAEKNIKVTIQENRDAKREALAAASKKPEAAGNGTAHPRDSGK